MNAFHPALTGVLYGALAQHEQAFLQMQLAANLTQADVDDETAERYAAIVTGLKRLIAIAEPAKSGSSALETNEGFMRAYVLLGSLIPQVPEFDVWTWGVRDNEISANYRTMYSNNDAARAGLRTIADRLSIGYIEHRHSRRSTNLYVAAKGDIDGVTVDIWALIEAERPFCDRHDAMVDADGVCRYCRPEMAAGDRHAMLPDGTETARCDAIGGVVALMADDVTCLECLALMAQQAQEAGADTGEYDPDDPDHVADSDGTARYTEDQFAGIACAGCGNGFVGAEPRVRVGHTLPGGGVVTDLGMSAHPDCIDSSNPELGDTP